MSDYPEQTYGMAHKYQPRMYDKWGFNPRNMNLSPFLRDIQIFSLHNKRFTEYRLINPFITSWRHGEHNSGEGQWLIYYVNSDLTLTLKAAQNATLQISTQVYTTTTGSGFDTSVFDLVEYDPQVGQELVNIFNSVYNEILIKDIERFININMYEFASKNNIDLNFTENFLF